MFSQTPGDFDLSFNGSGKVILDYGDLDHCEDLLIDSLDNIMFAGYTTTFGTITNTDFLVGKLKSSGVVDSTFGVNGFYTGDYPKANASFIHNIAPLSDGFLLFGSGLKYGVADTQYIYVQKIDLNGFLDTTFADSGTFAGVFLSTYNFAGSMAIQDDGKIVVCGSAYDSLTVQDVPLIGRLTANGLADITFSPSGFKYWDLSGVLQDAGNNFPDMPEHGAGGFLDDVIVMKNGNYFFSGFYDSGTSIHCLMMMIDNTGNFVSSFALGGYQVFQNHPAFANKIVRSVLFQDQILLGIYLYDNGAPQDFLIQPIDTFGVFKTPFTTDFSGQRDVLKEMVIVDNQLFLTGHSTLQSNISPGYFSDYFSIAKYDIAGFVSTPFGSNGQFLAHYNTNDEAGSNCLFGRNNKIVIGGYLNNLSGNNITDFGFMRLHNSNTVGIAEVKTTKEVQLFPNPTTGLFNIATKSNLINIEIVNLLGKKIKPNGSTKHAVDVSNCSRGMYLVNLYFEDGTSIQEKLIVE